MGFHKRFITKEGLLSHYNYSGIDGVKGYYSADALFFHQDDNGEKLSEIHHLLFEKKYEEIEKIISSLK